MLYSVTAEREISIKKEDFGHHMETLRAYGSVATRDLAKEIFDGLVEDMISHINRFEDAVSKGGATEETIREETQILRDRTNRFRQEYVQLVNQYCLV